MMTLSWMNLPAGVTFEIAPLADLGQGLMTAEAQSLNPQAGERRRREFMAGRCLARRLLAPHGYGDHTLLPAADGAPQWPPGMTGSISHCRDLVFAAVAATQDIDAIGIDIETLARFHDELARPILTAGEWALLPEDPIARRRQMAIAFAAKEAFYKYQFVLFGEKLAFQDAEIHIQASKQTAAIVMTNPEKHDHLATDALVHYALSGTHVAAMVLRCHRPENSGR
ncbi:MAG: 4'-phosphopantetheinyl transferase superfamily protein [Alphaproteobacteria bacterium]|nr:4'-phosphopantetheinyl transferase superfamily protein [Alphaproteobacteria bacterium]